MMWRKKRERVYKRKKQKVATDEQKDEKRKTEKHKYITGMGKKV